MSHPPLLEGHVESEETIALHRKLKRLEDEVAELRRELMELKQQMESFRKQFD